jgi:DNA-directed RNA polymerase, mitochondrial
MRPAIDALNALQAVPWTINKPVLGVIRECADYGLEVPRLPQHEIATPDKHSWNELTSDERALRKLKRIPIILKHSLHA